MDFNLGCLVDRESFIWDLSTALNTMASKRYPSTPPTNPRTLISAIMQEIQATNRLYFSEQDSLQAKHAGFIETYNNGMPGNCVPLPLVTLYCWILERQVTQLCAAHRTGECETRNQLAQEVLDAQHGRMFYTDVVHTMELETRDEKLLMILWSPQLFKLTGAGGYELQEKTNEEV